MRIGALASPELATHSFLTGRNFVELSLLWAVHLVLATVILVPGTPLDALRQVTAFFYLLVVPGLLLVRLLRVYQEDPLAQLVTAVGLSLVYDMVLGLVLSGIPSLVIERPLAAEVFLPSSLVITAALYLAVRTERGPLIPLALFARPSSLAWALLPLASVFVALHVQSTGPNQWMVAFVAVIAALPLLLLVRLPTARECMVALFSIALAVAFHKLFITPGLNGSDIRGEYAIAAQVLELGRWFPMPYRYGSMLSITVLPVIASLMSGVSLLVTFKVLFGIIIALVPTTLVLCFRSPLGIRWALAVALLYIGHVVFSGAMVSPGRQTVATFLIILLVLTGTTVKPRSGRAHALQMVLALAIVFSHYSMVPLVVVVFGVSLAISYLVRRRIALEPGSVPALPSLGLLLVVVSFAYIWFSWASVERMFGMFVVVGMRIAQDIMVDLLFNRQAIRVATGALPSGVSYWMLLGVNWAILFTSVAGFAAFVYSVLLRDSSKVYLGIVTAGGIVMAGIFAAIPGTTESFNANRALFFTLPWLLPLAVYGLKQLTLALRPTLRINQAFLLCGVFCLSVYIALGTGLIGHLMGDKPLSYTLKDTQLLALNIYDEVAASFIASFGDEDAPVYTDNLGHTLFRGIDPQRPTTPPSLTMLPAQSSALLYLRKANIEGFWSEGAIFQRKPGGEEKPEDSIELAESLASTMDRLYDSGGALLYYSP